MYTLHVKCLEPKSLKIDHLLLKILIFWIKQLEWSEFLLVGSLTWKCIWEGKKRSGTLENVKEKVEHEGHKMERKGDDQ